MAQSKNQIRVRAVAIVLRDGMVLLARHKKKGQTYWVLPGGRVEFGETLPEAVAREIKEETNLDIRVGRLVFVDDYLPTDDSRHVIDLYFAAEVVGGALCLGNDTNLAEVRFVSPDEFASLPFFPDIRDNILSGIREGFPETAAYLGRK